MDYQGYKTIILEQMKSVLKPDGFHKSGSTFSASKNDVVLFVQLQSSTKTSHTALVATINLGIVSLVILEREGIKSKPSILDAHWNERIGFLLPERLDKWREVKNQGEANQAGQDITQILNSQALPLLNSLSSTKNLVALWQTGRSPGLINFQREKFLALVTK